MTSVGGLDPGRALCTLIEPPPEPAARVTACLAPLVPSVTAQVRWTVFHIEMLSYPDVLFLPAMKCKVQLNMLLPSQFELMFFLFIQNKLSASVVLYPHDFTCAWTTPDKGVKEIQCSGRTESRINHLRPYTGLSCAFLKKMFFLAPLLKFKTEYCCCCFRNW